MNRKLTVIARVCALVVGTTSIGLSGVANAQSSNQDIKQQIDVLQNQVQALKSRLDNAPAAAGGHEYIERKPGDGITFQTRGGEVTFYGNLDVSLDSTNKGIGNMVVAPGLANAGDTPVGNSGAMAAISTNLSYVGLRGMQSLGNYPANFVWQLETQIDISATSGTTNTNSNTSDLVKGGLTSRNSFIGLASSSWGAFKIGKTDAPYKTSTTNMNPFSGMLGDYSVIMGNTGGDNRVEFGTRLDHALWYESPNMGGFTVNALVAPGQNRATDNSNIASGSSDCTGGNIPSSGAPAVISCADGSFGNAYSINAAYRTGGLYVTAAYELHQQVNRVSDNSDANDIGDETAAKIGAQYRFASTRTTVSGIYEVMNRNVPDSLVYYNERSRSGTWLAISQELGAKDSLHFGWAHANQTPGDPGVHNTVGPTANQDNSADMYTLAWKHQVDKNFNYYATYAVTANGPAAHYDLGAGGRAVTTDCHDAAGAADGTGHCYAGGQVQGVSMGMKYMF